MPRMDGTGPEGRGAMTGRGLGPCGGGNAVRGGGLGRRGRGNRPLCGRGYGRGFGRGFGMNEVSAENRKQRLEEHKALLQEELNAINQELDSQ